MRKKYTCRSQSGSSSCLGVTSLIYFFKDWLPQLIKFIIIKYGTLWIKSKVHKKNIYVY